MGKIADTVPVAGLWPRLVLLDPRLNDLLCAARAVADDPQQPSFCAESAWVDFRARLALLVGRERYSGPEMLRTRQAYHAATIMLFTALPACRSCDCPSAQPYLPNGGYTDAPSPPDQA